MIQSGAKQVICPFLYKKEQLTTDRGFTGTTWSRNPIRSTQISISELGHSLDGRIQLNIYNTVSVVEDGANDDVGW